MTCDPGWRVEEMPRDFIEGLPGLRPDICGHRVAAQRRIH